MRRVPAALLLLIGCEADRARECTMSDDCVLITGDTGVCVASPTSTSSWCVYRDETCSAGLTWGPLAGDGLAEGCLDIGEQPIWAVTGGGTFDDAVFATAIDEQGTKIVLAGSFNGALNFPGCNPLTSVAGSTDAFVVVLGPLGQCGWAERYGGNGSDQVKAVAIDGMSNIVLVGDFEDTVSFGGDILQSDGATDIFLAHLSGHDGGHLASRSLGGPANDHATGVAVFGDEHVVVGHFDGQADFGSGTMETSAGSFDIFVAKYNGSSQAYAWARTYGGMGDDRGRAVAVDGDGDVLLTGDFRETVDFGAETYDAEGGSSDIFVVKLDGSGLDDWALRFGGPEEDAGQAIGADSVGNVYVGGRFASTIDFGDGSPVEPTGEDAFLARLTSAGQLEWAKKFGGDGSEVITGVSVGPSSVAAAGTFMDVVDFGGIPLASRGGEDVFVLQVNQTSGAHERSAQIGGTGADAAHSVSIADTGAVVVGGAFRDDVDFGSGPVSSAGMSDFFGGFYAP